MAPCACPTALAMQAKPGWQRKFSRGSFPAGKAGDNRFIYAAMVMGSPRHAMAMLYCPLTVCHVAPC